MGIKKVVVAGGGVLGSQIAFQCAYKGYDVTVWLRSEGSVGRARPKFERLLGIYEAALAGMQAHPDDPRAWCRGLAPAGTSAEELEGLKARARAAHDGLALTTSLAQATADADLVIECIAENPQDKVAFYTELAPLLPPQAIIATNSSTMLPSAFAQFTGRPERYLALHFANEIWKNNTAEVMGHAGTSPEAYEAVAAFAESIGMVALRLHKEQPGYILNTMLVPFLSAAEGLLANGVADVETIDRTWQLATGAPAGPFRILDIVGLTTAYNIGMLDPRAKDPQTTQGKVAALLKGYIDAGKTGVNAGEGFYSYR